MILTGLRVEKIPGWYSTMWRGRRRRKAAAEKKRKCRNKNLTRIATLVSQLWSQREKGESIKTIPWRHDCGALGNWGGGGVQQKRGGLQAKFQFTKSKIELTTKISKMTIEIYSYCKLQIWQSSYIEAGFRRAPVLWKVAEMWSGAQMGLVTSGSSRNKYCEQFQPQMLGLKNVCDHWKVNYLDCASSCWKSCRCVMLRRSHQGGEVLLGHCVQHLDKGKINIDNINNTYRV